MLAQDPLGYVHEVPELGYSGYAVAEYPDGSIGEVPLDGYGGYAGYYLADLWVLEGTSWRPEAEQSGRRRTVTLPQPGSAGASWLDRATRW